MEGKIAPYKPRPRLLEVVLALKEFAMPVFMLPYAWVIVSGVDCHIASPFLFTAISMQLLVLDAFARSYLAKRMFKKGRHPNRILVDVIAQRVGSKSRFSDIGVLQIEDGSLRFEGIDSSFDIPIDTTAVECCFETDSNYSSLKLKVAYCGGYTFTIRQKWNWNEGYRLGDLRDEMLKPPAVDDGQVDTVILPPDSNNCTSDPWLIVAGYSVIALSVATLFASWIRTVNHLPMPIGLRPTWVITIIMLLLGVGMALVIRHIKRKDVAKANRTQNLLTR